RPAVELDDLPGHGEAETGTPTGGVGGKERLEKFCLVRRGDAGTGIVDLDGETRCVDAGPQGERASLERRLNGIQGQIHAYLLHLVPVQQQARRGLAPVAEDVDMPAGDFEFHESER